MRQGKKWIAILLTVLLLAGVFAGCGKGEIVDDPATADPNLGVYKLNNADGFSIEDYADIMGMSLEDARNSFTVELLSKGKAKMVSDGETVNGTWTLDGDKFTLKETGGSYDGTLKNGVMTIDIDGSIFEFTKDSAKKPGSSGGTIDPAAPTDAPETEPPETEPTETEPAVSKYEWWAGEWYGWWSIIEGEGDFEQLGIDGSAWDCYANIVVNPDDTGTVNLWYSGNYKDEPMFSAEVSFMSGLSDKGVMILESGEMFPEGNWNMRRTEINPMEMSYFDWYVDPADSTVTQFEDMIEISGHYTDPEDEEQNFEYRVYLRPWGMRWEDVEDGDTSECVYSDMMPIHYEEWYLPLVELGYPGAPYSYDDGFAIIDDEEPYEPGFPLDPDNGGGGEPEFVPTPLDPNDKEGATGEVSMETLQRCLEWCKWDTSYSTTYEEVAEQFGAHGRQEDCPFEGKTIYRWWCGEAYIQITFDVHEDGSETWNVTQWDNID